MHGARGFCRCPPRHHFQFLIGVTGAFRNRLLDGKTAAGHAEIPGKWAAKLIGPRSSWSARSRDHISSKRTIIYGDAYCGGLGKPKTIRSGSSRYDTGPSRHAGNLSEPTPLCCSCFHLIATLHCASERANGCWRFAAFPICRTRRANSDRVHRIRQNQIARTPLTRGGIKKMATAATAQALLEYEPFAMETFTLAVSESLGGPKIFIGEQKSFKYAELRDVYNKLGNFLHAPTVQARSDLFLVDKRTKPKKIRISGTQGQNGTVALKTSNRREWLN